MATNTHVLNIPHRLVEGKSSTGPDIDTPKALAVPIFNTASLVGFGAVIASLSAFGVLRDWVVTVGGDNPLISLAVGTSLLAGMTGSASGGMSIALATLGDTYLQMGQAAGIAPDLLHRVTAVATGSLDALPHNGAVITLLTICGLTVSGVSAA